MDYISREAAIESVKKHRGDENAIIASLVLIPAEDVEDCKICEKAMEDAVRKRSEHIVDAKMKAVLAALEREREYLLANGMDGAEHILVHHAINVVKDL